MKSDPPISIVLPWHMVAANDRAALSSMLSWRRSPEELRALRARLDLIIRAPAGTGWHHSPEVRRFFRGAKLSVGFFLNPRSPALLVYVVSQLNDVGFLDIDRAPLVGLRFRADDVVQISYALAQETMGLCVLAGLSEDESFRHCWELEVQIASRFNLD
jgi:hypothetical protein